MKYGRGEGRPRRRANALRCRSLGHLELEMWRRELRTIAGHAPTMNVEELQKCRQTSAARNDVALSPWSWPQLHPTVARECPSRPWRRDTWTQLPRGHRSSRVRRKSRRASPQPQARNCSPAAVLGGRAARKWDIGASWQRTASPPRARCRCRRGRDRRR